MKSAKRFLQTAEAKKAAPVVAEQVAQIVVSDGSLDRVSARQKLALSHDSYPTHRIKIDLKAMREGQFSEGVDRKYLSRPEEIR